ncbi:MAG: ABC transporter ATP-binding protein [Vicinamibacterales bacterium]
MASIALEGVEKIYATGHGGVRCLTLTVSDGEFVVLVGPSGSGKSTTLRLIAGLETPTQGRILIGGQDVTLLPPQDRDVAMVFQSYALYPHKSVRDNLAFGLRMRHVDAQVIDARIRHTADALHIGDLLERRPSQLSGGQRQRVALGRAIVREPKAFLFDEPLSNLDAGLRLETRAEIALLHQRLQATMVYVTHDQEEAMTLGDRIVVMCDGDVVQAGPPMEVYAQPASLFVARFIGSPPMNILRDMPQLACAPGTVVGIRPHDVTVVGHAGADATATVVLVEALGRDQFVHLRLATPEGQRLMAVASPDVRIDAGESVGLRFRRDRLHLFDAASGARITSSDAPRPVSP